jgi:hypothetical protein
VNGPPLFQVKWDVFTAAFRKIRTGTSAVSNFTQIRWDLEDQQGARVSQGVYYLRIEVNGVTGHRIVIKKVLVLR